MSKRLLPWMVLSIALLGATACDDDETSTGKDAGAHSHDGDSDHDHGEDDAGAKLDFASFDKALQDAIDSYNDGAGADAKIKGASAVVVHEKLGTLHTKAFGEFAEDRLYLVASSSKILSVGVLMRLADQGKLDIDKAIGTYLKDWGDTKASAITVAQLVSNSSGLPSLSEVSGAATAADSPFSSNLCQYTDQGSLQDCGKTLYATDPPRKPDTQFAYGGSQWQLAGAIAEVVSGKSWADLITETYSDACDVPSLGFTNQFGKASLTYPTFFDAKKENLPVTNNPSIEGGAFVNVGDYGKLLTMHLRGGTCGDKRVLSKDATDRMQKNRIKDYGGNTGNPAAPGYGLGFWVNETDKYVIDPGAYGAFPLLDQERRYGFFIAIELTSDVGVELGMKVKPSLDKIFDDADL